MVRTQSIATGEGLSGEMNDCAFDVRLALLLLSVGFNGDALNAQPIREINGSTQQSAQVADRVRRAAEVLPAGFDDIREQLPGALRLAHEFENQKFTKSQWQEALKVRGEASWLSLLTSRV